MIIFIFCLYHNFPNKIHSGLFLEEGMIKATIFKNLLQIKYINYKIDCKDIFDVRPKELFKYKTQIINLRRIRKFSFFCIWSFEIFLVG